MNCSKIVTAFLGIALLAWLGVATAQQTPEAIEARLKSTGELALIGESQRIDMKFAREGKFAELDALAETYTREHSRFPDGRSKLESLFGVVRFYTNIDMPVEEFAPQLEYQQKAWRAVNPRSALAAVSEAHVWNKYAWRLRGGGYADTVSKEGWKGFEEYIAKAEKVLLDSKDYADSLPLWYEEMISVQLTRSRTEMDRYYAEGIKKFPWYFQLHFSALTARLPQWGASVAETDKFITDIATKEGDPMYARLYWAYAGQAGLADLFKDSRAKWPRMKKGFQALLKDTQNDVWTANNYARFACMAEDKDAFRQAEKIIDGAVDGWAWSGSTSYPLCRKLYGR